jgi:RNA polymerase sigma-70 factor, ECF subfamily
VTAVRDDPDDAELLRAHVAGDRDAFAELVRRHRDRLWAVAVRTLGDREEAADAVQDALVSAFRGADRFRGDSAVTTWLHRIVVNACLDRMRRRQARPTVPFPEHESSLPPGRGAALSPDTDTALTVQAALAQLPAEQRVALVLLDMQGYPVAEIAAMLGIAEGTVKSRCARGRARLAVLLGHLRPSGASDHTTTIPGNRGSPDDVGSAKPRQPNPGAQPTSTGVEGTDHVGQGGVW